MNYKRLFISLLLPQLAGGLGALFTTNAIPLWYSTLEKPIFAPPNWIFGPVWTILYLMMGLAAYLIWQKMDQNKKAKEAMILFYVHLAINTSWSLVFFGLKKPGMAFINILLLWAMILCLIFKFWSIDRRSSYLMIPYLLWVSFATVLNVGIWWLSV